MSVAICFLLGTDTAEISHSSGQSITEPTTNHGVSSQSKTDSIFLKPGANDTESRVDNSCTQKVSDNTSNLQSCDNGNDDSTACKLVVDTSIPGTVKTNNSHLDNPIKDKSIACSSVLAKSIIEDKSMETSHVNNLNTSSKTEVREITDFLQSKLDNTKLDIKHTKSDSGDTKCSDNELSQTDAKIHNDEVAPSTDIDNSQKQSSNSSMITDLDCTPKDGNKEANSYILPGSTDTLSPEKIRAATSGEMISPPLMDTSLVDDDESADDNSLLPNDNELTVASAGEDSEDAPSGVEIKDAMNSLLGQTVATVDGHSEADDCSEPLITTVSSTHRSNTGGISGSRISTESLSDDEHMTDCLPAKRARLSPSADQPQCRLNKVCYSVVCSGC